MLSDKSSSAIVAVSDLARARTFYVDTLGLKVVDNDDQIIVLQTGDTRLVVYVSEFAGSNRANAVVWGVDDQIDAIVADLTEKGVTFEHYDMDGARYEGGIHHFDAVKLVWFKDPDGNLLHLNNM